MAIFALNELTLSIPDFNLFKKVEMCGVGRNSKSWNGYAIGCRIGMLIGDVLIPIERGSTPLLRFFSSTNKIFFSFIETKIFSER